LEAIVKLFWVSSLSCVLDASGVEIDSGVDGWLVQQIFALKLVVGVDSEEGEREISSS
jgi:hypothetical protein